MGKAIIGGAIGAALGAVIWLGVENSMSRSLPWLALLVGLFAGLGVRCCCGKGPTQLRYGHARSGCDAVERSARTDGKYVLVATQL